MKHYFLIFTLLAFIAVTTIIIKQVPVKSVQQSKKMNVKMKPIFLKLFSQKPLCSAVVIHEQWVLTTAHCIAEGYSTESGIYLFSRENTSIEEITLKATFVFAHPNFSLTSADHDLMLIKMNSSLNLKDRIQLPVLPSSKDDRIGEMCTVFGWTQHWYETGTWSVSESYIQMQQDVFWLPTEFCYAPGIPIQVTKAKNIFCASSNLPFIHSEQGPYDAVLLCQNILYGILVWAKGCVLKGDIGYYIKISHYSDWILEIIKNN